VYGLAQRILSSRAEAEEILQEVFLQLWRRAPQFDPARGTLAGFLVTLARSASIDRLRARHARRTEPAGLVDSVALVTPVDLASLEDARGHVARALATLPEAEKAVLELAYFEGLSQSEIAERTGSPLGTVKGRARNGLRRLRAALPRSLGGDR
jgi:RNA polymerase sigma-70 factor, ECF subfamily